MLILNTTCYFVGILITYTLDGRLQLLQEIHFHKMTYDNIFATYYYYYYYAGGITRRVHTRIEI